MKLKNHAICLSLILTVCFTSSALACNACNIKSSVSYQKELNEKRKAIKLYGSLFFSEEQLLLVEETGSANAQEVEESVSILPALYYVLSDRVVIKAVYNKFIMPISPEEAITPQLRPADSLTVGLDFHF